MERRARRGLPSTRRGTCSFRSIGSRDQEGCRDHDRGPSGFEAHVLGRAYPVMPIPMVSEPHHHFIRNAEQANVVVRIDTFAELMGRAS
jgi:hypothetical protein